MKASAIRWRVRRPPRSSVELALKAAVAAALAIWASEELGLQDSYWAGISAVVAAAGTLGASLDAAVSRIAATAIGLLVGLAAVALPVSGTLVDAVAVFVALLVLAALSLDAGARLGGATTLLLTAVPGHDAVSDALSRGANVPLGCACAIAVGLVVLPHRAAQQLRADVTTDLQRAGRLAHAALIAYVSGAGADQLRPGLQELVHATSARTGAMHTAEREPLEHGERLLRLRRSVAAVDSLVDEVGTLVKLVAGAPDHQAPPLLSAELTTVGEAFDQAARTIATEADHDRSPAELKQLTDALASLDAGFADARERRATVRVPTEELTRLMSVIRTVHGASAALARAAALALSEDLD